MVLLTTTIHQRRTVLKALRYRDVSYVTLELSLRSDYGSDPDLMLTLYNEDDSTDSFDTDRIPFYTRPRYERELTSLQLENLRAAITHVLTEIILSREVFVDADNNINTNVDIHATWTMDDDRIACVITELVLSPSTKRTVLL